MKAIMLLISFLSFSYSLCAQDLLFKKNGDTLKVKVLSIEPEIVAYKRYENLYGPNYLINKSEVYMIQYQNGTKDVFAEPTAITEQIYTPNKNVATNVNTFANTSIRLKRGYKRGSMCQISWQTSNPEQHLKVELLYRDNLIEVIEKNIPNTGNYDWKIPYHERTRHQRCTIKITDVDNPQNNLESNYFAIKPRVPVFVKVGIPCIVGGTVIVGAVVLFWYSLFTDAMVSSSDD